MSKQQMFSKSNMQLKKLPTKKQTAIDKKALLSYLSGEYGMTYFNKIFAYKLEHIHEGTLQNLQVPIPYNVLLEMFKHFKNELNKQRICNRKKGKTFTDKQAELNYDLAIVLSKHSDYLQAVESKKIWDVENNTTQTAVKLVGKVASVRDSDEEAVDIGKMLDEW